LLVDLVELVELLQVARVFSFRAAVAVMAYMG
jgi:hypothetical protein